MAAVLSSVNKGVDVENGEYRDFILRILTVCQWLDPPDLTDPGLQVNVLVRSHVVAKVVSPSGNTVFVKFPTKASLDNQRHLNNELFVYRLANWHDFFRELLPQVIFLNEQKQVLVVESLVPATNSSWLDTLASHTITDAFVLNNLAAAMATWHTETENMALLPSLAPGILHIETDFTEVVATRSDAGQKLFHLLREDKIFFPHLKKCRDTYEMRCLIHGDIRADNMMIKAAGNSLVLKVIDWEISGAGDPMWDIASVFAEILINSLRAKHGNFSGGEQWLSLVAPAGKKFSKAYKMSGGKPMDTDKIVDFTAARLLHVASEWAEQEQNWAGGLVNGIVQAARDLIKERERAIREIGSFL